MKAIIFNGALERRSESTSDKLSSYIVEKLKNKGIDSQVFNIAESGIPLFDTSLTKSPLSVIRMNQMFLEADIHFWLAPLYHGSIPGVMKNCIDWLEESANNPKPYLTDKTVALVCWADGVQAMQGINTMDAIAKSLRAWPLPFSVPIVRGSLYDSIDPKQISDVYKAKLDRLIHIATSRRVEMMS